MFFGSRRCRIFHAREPPMNARHGEDRNYSTEVAESRAFRDCASQHARNSPEMDSVAARDLWRAPFSRSARLAVRSSGQPKELSFGFRSKVSVLVRAKMIRQKSVFRSKGHFRQKHPISSLFWQEMFKLFRPKALISAEIPSFGCFLPKLQVS